MPKLESVLNNITSIEKRLSGNDSNTKNDLTKIIRDSAGDSASVFTGRVEKALIEILTQFGESQVNDRKQMLVVISEMLNVLNENQKILDKRLSELDKSAGGAQNTLNESVKGSEKVLVGIVQSAAKEQRGLITKTEELIKALKFPEPEKVDLSMLENMLVELSKQMVKPQTEWRFNIERDANNRIEDVIATPTDAG